jgi:hypothetical protein
MSRFKLNNLQLIYLVLILALALPLHQAAGGAWPQKKGTGYYKLDFRYMSSSKLYNSDGIKVSIPKLQDITIGLFGSYGITDKLTGFIGVAAFKSIKLDTVSSAVNFDTDVSGFGDINVGLKYAIGKIGKTVFSTKIIFGLPTGKATPDSSLWTGSGDFNQAFGLEVGHSFSPAPFYLNGGVTYNNRTKGFSDEFGYIIEGGYKIIKHLTLIVRFHGKISMKNGNPNVIGGYGTYMNNQQFFAYNTELVYKVTKNFGVKGYYESGGKGKNIISSPVISAGIFFTH